MGITDPYNNPNDPNRIVRSFLRPNAPTAEGMCYETADGRVWRETMSRSAGTAETIARLRNGRVEPIR